MSTEWAAWVSITLLINSVSIALLFRRISKIEKIGRRRDWDNLKKRITWEEES